MPVRLLFLTLLGLPQLLFSQSWKPIEMQPMPVKISNNAVTEAFVNGQAYVYSFGGIDSTKSFSGISNRSFKYTVATDTWDTIPDMPDPMTKIAAAASFVNGKVYVIGGYTVFSNGNEISSSVIHRYDPVADTFLTDGASIPVAIDDHVQCVYKDSLIYVVSGWSNTTNVKNVQIYDTYLDTWTQATQVPFNEYRIFGSTGVILNDTIYYFGGAARSFNFPATNILRKGAINPSNPAQITWSFSRPNLSVFSYRNAATLVGNEIHWLGGSSTTYNYNGIAYNGTGGVSPSNWSLTYSPFTNSFQTFPPDSGLLPMDLRGVASINDTVKYLVGGMVNNQRVTNKTLRLEYSRIATAIAEMDSKRKWNVYPNPANEQVILQFKNAKQRRVELYSLTGKLMLTEQVFSDNDYLNVERLSNGIYLLKISTEGEVLSRKISILH